MRSRGKPRKFATLATVAVGAGLIAGLNLPLPCTPDAPPSPARSTSDPDARNLNFKIFEDGSTDVGHPAGSFIWYCGINGNKESC